MTPSGIRQIDRYDDAIVPDVVAQDTYHPMIARNRSKE